MAVVAHEGAGVDHVGQAFSDGAFFVVEHFVEAVALGGFGDHGPVAVDDLVDLVSFVDQDDGLLGGAAADTGAIFLDAADVGRDQVLVDQGADAVMDEDGVALPAEKARGLGQAVVNGHLAGRPAGDDRGDLVQAVCELELLHVGDPVLDADDDDGVDLRVVIENLDRVDDDGFAVHKEELLGPVLGVHALAGSACENYCYIHKIFLHT